MTRERSSGSAGISDKGPSNCFGDTAKNSRVLSKRREKPGRVFSKVSFPKRKREREIRQEANELGKYNLAIAG